MRSIAITIMVAALGCDLPGNNTSSTDTEGTTTSLTSSIEPDSMSSTSAPPTTEPLPTTTTSPTSGDEPPVTVCHDVLGGVGVEPPEELVGQVCKTCSGEDCGCLWGIELGGQCVLDCESDPCPKDLTCLHLQWDGQDAWGCWPHAEPEPESEPEPEPTCTPIVDLQGTVIGEVCPSAGCPLGVEPLTGLCLQPCELGCLKGQACMDVVLDLELLSVCWPSEA